MSTRSVWQSPPLPAEVDVAIVGGGVMGCATAFALSEADPALRVAIMEAETLAHGASGRNAGFLLLGAPGADPAASDPVERERSRRLWEFTRQNAEAVRDLDGEAFGLTWSGSAIAAGSEHEATQLRALADAMGGVTWRDPEDLDTRLHARGFLGGVVVRDGGSLDPARLVGHLAVRSNAVVCETCSATEVGPDAEGVAVQTSRGTVRARHVVLTLNAYLPRLVPDLVHIVRPVRAQMLATAPLPAHLDLPVYSHDGYFYVRQRRDGRILVGGARHLHEAEEIGYEDRTTDVLQADLGAYLSEHFPFAADAEIERRWSGTMGFSPDGLPVVGDVPGIPGAIYAAGFTGHGMGYAVRFGRLLAARVLGEPDPATDLFDVSRFDQLRGEARGSDTSVA